MDVDVDVDVDGVVGEVAEREVAQRATGERHGVPRRVTVRYFASAAAATGCDEQVLELARHGGDPTVGDVVEAVVAAHPDAERLMALCSILAAGQLLTDRLAPLGEAQVIDVLPPFAGG